MTYPSVSPSGLLCALVLAPHTFARNRFFGLFEQPHARRVRRRALHVRSIVRQLAGHSRHQAEVIGEQILDDGRVLLRYHVPALSFTRTTALSRLEAAVLRYALHRTGRGHLSAEDRALVQEALCGLGGTWRLDTSDEPGLQEDAARGGGAENSS